MKLKEYNQLQVKLFNKHKLVTNTRFVEACEIISHYRELNLKYHTIKSILKELKQEKII